MEQSIAGDKVCAGATEIYLKVRGWQGEIEREVRQEGGGREGGRKEEGREGRREGGKEQSVCEQFPSFPPATSPLCSIETIEGELCSSLVGAWLGTW